MRARPTRLALLPTLAAAALVSTAPSTAAPAGCLPRGNPTHWSAVFGHFAAVAEARAMERRVRAVGFSVLEVWNDGCGVYELGVAGVDTAKQRAEFTAEALSAGFQVSFEPSGTGRSGKPSDWVAVFGHFPTVAKANSFLVRAATAGFRIIDVERAGRRDYKVVVANVPSAKAQEFAAQARRAGFSVLYEVG